MARQNPEIDLPRGLSGAADAWTTPQASVILLGLYFEPALNATNVTTGAPVIGSPALSHALTATGIATGPATVGSAALVQAQVLTATGISTGAPVIPVLDPTSSTLFQILWANVDGIWPQNEALGNFAPITQEQGVF